MFQGELCQNITAKAIESVRGVSNLVDVTKHPSYVQGAIYLGVRVRNPSSEARRAAARGEEEGRK